MISSFTNIFLCTGVKVNSDYKKMSLGEMAQAALSRAVARVVEEHRKSGQPLAVWRDGKAVYIPADQLSTSDENKGNFRKRKAK